MATPRTLRMGYVIRDAKGAHSSFQIWPTIDGDMSWINALSELVDFSQYWKPFIAGEIVQIIWSRSPDLWYPINAPALDECDVENVGILRFLPGANGRAPMSLQIPAVQKGYFDNKILRADDPDLADLLFFLNNGYQHATFGDPWGNTFAGLRDGYLSRHKSRNR